MSDLNPDITEDMIERAAHSLAAGDGYDWDGYDWDEVSEHWQSLYRTKARAAVGAALAGRVPVALPAFEERDDEDDPMWVIPGGGQIVACVIEGKPFVVSDPPSFRPVADRVEKFALALLAAAREARRLATGGR